MSSAIALLLACAVFVGSPQPALGQISTYGAISNAGSIAVAEDRARPDDCQINVKDFSAKGDGKADDTQAITRALTAAAPNSTICFPKGTYLTDTQPAIKTEGLRVVGANAKNTKIRLKKNAMSKTRLLAFTGRNVTISDLALDANAAENIGGFVDTLFLGGDDALLQRVEISGSAYMDVQITGSRVAVLDSVFIGSRDASLESGNGIWSLNIGNSDLTIAGNRFLNHKLTAIFADADRMLIARNYFRGNHFQTEPTGGGQIAFAGKGTIIAGNFIDEGGGSATTGIEANEGALIVDNTIQKQGRSGIYLQNGKGYTITGNTIKNNNTRGMAGGAGVAIGSTNPISDVRISGNRIVDDRRNATQEFGVSVASSATRFIITGNDLRENKLGSLKDDSTTSDKQISGNLLDQPLKKSGPD